MSYDSIDYQRIRARTEQRIMPLLRLQRRRTWLLFHTAFFVMLNLVIYSVETPVTFVREDMVISYTDSGATAMIHSTHPYIAIILLSLMWMFLLIANFMVVSMAIRRENVIQREMNKEAELERLRLSIVLARFGESVDDPLSQTLQRKSEKPKRTVSLTDDGELIANDELPDKPLRQNMNHREG